MTITHTSSRTVNPPLTNEESERLRNIEATRFFRAALPREEQIQAPTESVQENIEHDNEELRLATLDDNHQEILESTLGNLNASAGDIIDSGEFSAAEDALLEETQRLCGEIMPTVREGVLVSKIERLQINVNQLKKNHKEFEILANDLQSVIDSVRPSPGLAM